MLNAIFSITIALSGLSGVERTVPFEQLLTQAELRIYQTKPDYRSRMDLIRRVLERQGAEVRRRVRNTRYQEAVAALGAIEIVSWHAQELTAASAQPRDFRSKKVRRLEIQLRKLIEMLQDLMSAPPFEYRTSFERATEALDQLRGKLLEGYFKEELARDAPLALAEHAWGWATASTAVRQRGLRSTVHGDQFTDQELEAIRDAQDLKPRVKVFLEIAEARLDELSRRLSQRPWTREEPNPLEFFTYAQLARAYHRSLESLMINIDEKARFGTAKDKDIRKSLQLVNKKMQDLIPQLEPIRKLAVETEDEDLFVEVRRAIRVSKQALQGSQLGLGAPSQ